MYKFYQALTAIKRQFPNAHHVEYHESTGNDVLVIKVTGVGKAMVIYINVGRTSGEYQMNPADILHSEYQNIAALNGAPAVAGGDIGHAQWGISVFQAK